jgi:hypothetical protein
MNDKSNDPVALWLCLLWIGLPITFVVLAVLYQFFAIMGWDFTS